MDARDTALSGLRADRIRQALAVPGGHVFIGHNGGLLHYARGGCLHRPNGGAMKAACAAARLPVIDCRHVSFTGPLRSCLDWPRVAVGKPADLLPPPFDGQVSLAEAAAIYRDAGAEVLNLPPG